MNLVEYAHQGFLAFPLLDFDDSMPRFCWLESYLGPKPFAIQVLHAGLVAIPSSQGCDQSWHENQGLSRT